MTACVQHDGDRHAVDFGIEQDQLAAPPPRLHHDGVGVYRDAAA